MNWSPEDDRLLTRMWEGGSNGKTIAAELCRTLDAVYGRAGTLKLSRRMGNAASEVVVTVSEGDTDKPVCVCGGRLEFQAWDGAAHEICRSCDVTRPVPVRKV